MCLNMENDITQTTTHAKDAESGFLDEIFNDLLADR